jgi:hypothetical protein
VRRVLRTRLNNSYIKRTIRPLYGWTQATPKSVFLDAAWDRSVPIYPGMVMMRTLGENVSLVGATTSIPYGLSALYVGGDGIDEPLDVGMNVFAVWVLTPDAEFEVLAPAFDSTQTWTDPGDGTETLIYGAATGTSRGKLALTTNGAAVTALTSQPVARLLKVNSATKITIGGIR